MKTLVSMNDSTLIHLVPGQFATDHDLAAQPGHNFLVTAHSLLLRVVAQPAPELFVERGVLGPSAFAGRLDHLFVGTQRNVSHRIFTSQWRTEAVYTASVRIGAPPRRREKKLQPNQTST